MPLENMSIKRLTTTPKFKNKLGKVGNNTYARHDVETGSVLIFLHGNLIVTYVPTSTGFESLIISDCGYGTPTTRNRLDAFLKDNNIPYVTSQKNHEQVLLRRNSAGDYTNHWDYFAGTHKALFHRYINVGLTDWSFVP